MFLLNFTIRTTSAAQLSSIAVTLTTAKSLIFNFAFKNQDIVCRMAVFVFGLDILGQKTEYVDLSWVCRLVKAHIVTLK